MCIIILFSASPCAHGVESASVGTGGLDSFTLTTDDDLDASLAATDELVLSIPEDDSNITLVLAPSLGDQAYTLMEFQLEVVGAKAVIISLVLPGVGIAPGQFTPVSSSQLLLFFFNRKT